MRPPRLGVVLVAHGSRDPRAAESTEALARAVAAAHPEWAVHASYLDHAGPRPLEVLRWLALSGHQQAVVVPLLLTAAYHGRVDIPAVLDEAAELPMDIRLAGVLGPEPGETVDPRLIDALVRRLPAGDVDAVVLAAAGTRDAAARETVVAAATALGVRLGLPCTVAYASAAPPTADAAVASLSSAKVAVASYFLAPGLLYDKAVEAALGAGAVSAADPLGDTPELVALVSARVIAATARTLERAA